MGTTQRTRPTAGMNRSRASGGAGRGTPDAMDRDTQYDLLTAALNPRIRLGDER